MFMMAMMVMMVIMVMMVMYSSNAILWPKIGHKIEVLWQTSKDGKKVLPFSQCTFQSANFKPSESEIGWRKSTKVKCHIMAKNWP